MILVSEDMREIHAVGVKESFEIIAVVYFGAG